MSFPNPTMLPFFAAGGAISGSSFGLFYTILMQIGYNFFGKKALKEIESGRRLSDILMDIQKELQPFSDEVMRLALASINPTIEKTVNTIQGLLKERGAVAEHNIAEHLLGFDTLIGDLGKLNPLPQAFGHTASGGATIISGGAGDDVINVGGTGFTKIPGSDPRPEPSTRFREDDIVSKDDFKSPAQIQLEKTIASRERSEADARTRAQLSANAERSKAALAAVSGATRGDEKFWFDIVTRANMTNQRIRVAKPQTLIAQTTIVKMFGFKSWSDFNSKFRSSRGWLEKNSSWARYSTWLRSNASNYSHLGTA